jgi:hypothetical protein
VPRRGSSLIFGLWPFVLMRCLSAGEIGCFDVSAGLSIPHLFRSPDFDGRPRFAAMMQFPCPWSLRPYSADLPDRAARASRKTARAHPTHIAENVARISLANARNISDEIATQVKALSRRAHIPESERSRAVE